MGGVLEGFGTIAIVIALGALLADRGIVDLQGQRSLSLASFYLASPALLVTVLEDSDPSRVLSGPLVATAAAARLPVARNWRRSMAMLPSLCSGREPRPLTPQGNRRWSKSYAPS